MRPSGSTAVLPLVLFILFAVPLSASDGWGASAAARDPELNLEEMLRYAIQDEYLARAEYAAILRKFGSTTPFSNIVKSEETHIAWLKEAYGKTPFDVPKDEAAARVIVPSTMKEALETGVDAEIANIAMYDSFLASDFSKEAANAYYRTLFERLRDASVNHLRAFRNALARY